MQVYCECISVSVSEDYFSLILRTSNRDITNSHVNRCTCPVFVRAKSCDFSDGLDTEISAYTARCARTCSRAFHATSETDRIQNNCSQIGTRVHRSTEYEDSRSRDGMRERQPREMCRLIIITNTHANRLVRKTNNNNFIICWKSSRSRVSPPPYVSEITRVLDNRECKAESPTSNR